MAAVGLMNRSATISRETKETCIKLSLDIDGGGVEDIRCEESFFTHMLETLGRYSGMDIELRAKGDNVHHLIEDVGIVLGHALREAMDETPVQRMSSQTVAMDDALVSVTADLADRPYVDIDCPDNLYQHFLRSFAMASGMTLHVMVLRGFDEHHTIEATFKALGLCLHDALQIREDELSTKGRVRRSKEC